MHIKGKSSCILAQTPKRETEARQRHIIMLFGLVNQYVRCQIHHKRVFHGRESIQARNNSDLQIGPFSFLPSESGKIGD